MAEDAQRVLLSLAKQRQNASICCQARQNDVFDAPSPYPARFMGGVSGEMLLGHWYLIDPRLPRWALRVLALAGIGGLALDGILLGLSGFLPDGGGTIAFWLLLGTSIVLMVAVVASLRYPAYSGVMAATGLSYLAVLTTLGAVFLGRALISGLGPLS